MATEEVEHESPPPVSSGTARGAPLRKHATPAPASVAPELSPRRRVLEARLPPESDPPSADTFEPQALSVRNTPVSALGKRSTAPGPEMAGPAAPRTTTGSLGSRWVGRDRLATDPKGVDRAASSLAMSPRMTALFGGLFGLATVTTIIALLIQGAPPRDDRAAAMAAEESASAAAAGEAAPGETVGPKKRVRTKVPGPWRIADAAKEPGVRVVEDTMGRRSFIGALGDKGVPKDQIYRILKAFDGVRKFDKTNRNDRFIVAMERGSNKVKAFEFVVSLTEVYQAKETDGLLVAQELDMKVAEEEYAGSFYVGKDIVKSMAWGGFEPDLARAIDEAFAGRMSHEGLEEGGVVKVIATEMTALGEFVKYKNIVALEYRPPDPQASPVRAYTFHGTGAKGYFDDRGRQPDGSGWASPVPGAPITSRFNPKRMHPVLKRVMPHNGTDYGAPTGTPIYAVYRGKVTHSGPAGPCGLMVAILHPNGIETGYCHMSKIAAGVKVGATVGTRQAIGQVGTTGRSTGPHLHFYTKKDGKYFDSETLKIDGFRVIPVDERPAFQARKSELDARLEGIELPEPPPVEAPKSAASAAPDDTRPNVGASGEEGDDPSPAPAPASPPSKPVVVDPGDGDDIMGADLRK